MSAFFSSGPAELYPLNRFPQSKVSLKLKQHPQLVGLGRLELPTSRLSGVRSNHLSYKPAPQYKGYVDSISTLFFLKGGDPAAGSPTATLLRLRPSRLPYRGRQAPSRVTSTPSGRTNSHGVTGGVYKTRERIHRGMLIRDY